MAVCLAAASGLVLTACDSGGGGDNGNANRAAQEAGPQGLVFSYPYNGQQNVTLTSQIAFRAQQPFNGGVTDGVTLRAADGDTAPDLSVQVIQDDNQSNVYRIQPSRALRGNTTYQVVATKALSSGDTRYGAGDTLFEFTTAPTPGAPSAGDFRVTEVAPGETNPVTGQTSIFAQFNTLHVSLSETIDPSTVHYGEQGIPDTFTVTGPDGNDVEGAMLVSGHEIAFDPAENLAPGNYRIALTGDVRSAFGKSLQPFSVTRTVLDSGKIVQQNLLVDNAQGFDGDADDSPLDGLMDNLVTVRTQLIGTNQQPAQNQPERAGVLVNLAEPGMPGFGDVFPTSLPPGSIVQLKPLSVALNGDVPTPLQSGPIQVQFGTDANVYLMANDYQDIESPTAVRLRFDLNNTTLIEAAPGTPEYIVQALANGVFNQSALNVQAAGLAIPQDNGDLLVQTLGTFPLTVNRSDDLTIDFSLTLRLPAGEQEPVQEDNVAPFVIAQTPSACLYTFGTPAYQPAYNQRAAAPTAFPEQACLQVLQQGGALNTASGINSFQIESSPAITFSEPLDPLFVNSKSIRMTTRDGSPVDVSYQVDGSSVVLRPETRLEPDTPYTIALDGSNLFDLGGNRLAANQAGGPGQMIQFRTEPLADVDVVAPAILGELTPGIPCALSGGNFQNGGDLAGHCQGSDTENDALRAGYPVFQSPKNVSVNASFSKFVQRDSVVLADGCLTSGAGGGNTVAGATVALERVNSMGQCIGAPEAGLAFLNTQSEFTRGFTIRPVEELVEGDRYQIVICGNQQSVCSATIVGEDGMALNTNPMVSLGSVAAVDDAAGGPDIIMPFEATGFTTNYYADTFALPYSDTNGNGQFDDGADNDGVFDSTTGLEERGQPGNRALVDVSARLLGIDVPLRNANAVGNANDGAFPSYLSLPRPIAIGQTRTDCEARLGSLLSITGEMPDSCIQVDLLPGGFTALTGLLIGSDPLLNGIVSNGLDPNDLIGLIVAVGSLGNVDGLNTGELLLRYPNAVNDSGEDAGPQAGYIVERCDGESANGVAYEYEPCFVANLDLVVSAPDGGQQGIDLDDQLIENLQLYGPVTFEQNGRIVISLRNATGFSLSATALGLAPATATVPADALRFQLTGNEIHGGRAFPER